MDARNLAWTLVGFQGFRVQFGPRHTLGFCLCASLVSLAAAFEEPFSANECAFTGEVTVVSAGFSAKGRVVAQSVKELEVVVDDRKYAALVKDGMVMNLAMQLPPEALEASGGTGFDERQYKLQI
jgi:hypothetical protein